MLIIERRDTAKPRRIWAYSRPYGPFIRRNWAAKWANFGAWGRAGGDNWAQNRPQRRVYRRLAPRGQFLCVLGGPTAGDALSSFFPNAGGLLHDAVPLASRSGLLLMRLRSVHEWTNIEQGLVRLAVCNPLARTWDEEHNWFGTKNWHANV